MDKKKQIEKMAFIIYATVPNSVYEHCKIVADVLVNKRYGNLKEFAEKIKALSITQMSIGERTYLCIAEEDIDELLKEY